MSINDALENLGFKTIGGRIAYEKLIKGATFPCVLHWDQNHFVILHKITNKNGTRIFHIGDPSKGNIEFTEDEFKSYWISTSSNGQEKGVALLCEATSKFFQLEDQKTETTNFSFLFGYFKKYKRFYLQLLLGLFLASILQLILPFLTQSIIDVGIKDKNIGFIYLILFAQLALFLGRVSVDFIHRWLLLHISVRINLSLLSDFFIKIMKLPMSFFDAKKYGDIIQRINDHDRVQSFITAQSLSVLFSTITFVVFGIVLFIYSVKIFIVFLLGSILYVLWITFFLKQRRKLDFKLFENRSKSQDKTYQLIYGMQELKLQNYQTQKRWEWEDVQADLFKIEIESLALEQKQTAGSMMLNELKNIIITIIAALTVINNEMTLGMMLATQYIIGQLNSPIQQIVELIHRYQDTKISLERINEIHDMEEENSSDKMNNIDIDNKEIHINNLVFQYEGPHSKKVLNNINLTIPKNKVTAIVGASGSGKTTLIKLLLNYYKPTSGTVKVDDYDLDILNSNSWRNICGAVMQDGYIFSETIAQNIATTNIEDINIERLEYAAKLANIHDFIMDLPLKYNTIIGNDGQNLSQGQIQRLLIARIIYKNPSFVFFDEATNALDASNEKVIVENLVNFFNNKTVVVVAHRLSTVKNADQIVVMDNGVISEIGNHQSLVAKRGAYFNLVKNQLELGN